MNISPAIQRNFSRSVLQIQKYSPQILTAVGIAGLVTAGVLAAKNTLKLEATLDESNERLRDVKDAKEGGIATQADVNRAVVRNTVELGKLYFFPLTLATGSVISILVGHRILHQRNLAVIAAYKGLEQFIADYRKRVVEEHGEEADQKYAYGVRDVEETIDGKKVKTQTAPDEHGGFIYSFDPTNENWSGRNEDNLFFLNRFQMIWNDKLAGGRRSHVFLNDVLRTLAIDDTREGAVTGWVYKAGSGDDYIDFGIKDLSHTANPRILLNFNVDGVIIDLI